MNVKPQIKLIIGLGNPGKEYEKSYHNAGSLFVLFLAQNPEVSVKLVPNLGVFMNESGPAVLKEMKKKGLKPEEILIVHDDADIEIGNYKLDFGRGAAGHHGIESIINSFGTKNFWRLRIGIAKYKKTFLTSNMKKVKAGNYVLKNITKADMEKLEKVFEESFKELVL